jgi:DNA ligase-1
MRFADVVEASRKTSETRARSVKIALLAECLRRMEPQEIPVGVALLSGSPRQRKIGVGPATLRAVAAEPAAEEPGLTLIDVDGGFAAIAETNGAGSEARRSEALRALFRRATREERDFLLRVAIGELRQGALEGVVVDAVAKAFEVAPSEVRRAHMTSGDLGAVARAAAEGGTAALAGFTVGLFRPIEPMLAGTASDLDQALATLGEASLEWKLDGARVQIHKAGDEVAVFSRSSNPVTASVPEIVERVRSFPARELILDGEAIALEPSGRPRPFQQTMRRFGRRLDVERLRTELPLTMLAFDLLWIDGQSLIASPAAERWQALAGVLPAPSLVSRLRSADPEAARRFLAGALEIGHEGIMAKALDRPYEAGRRGQSWLKVKPAHTLDLVVLAAEWGHGRRRGWLSNLHLGARDAASASFIMLGKTFKGMTDAMLAWQTARLLELEVSRDDRTVTLRPELVVEIAFNDVQASPHYPGGVALRFARVKRYRADKSPAQADTIDLVRALLPARGTIDGERRGT